MNSPPLSWSGELGRKVLHLLAIVLPAAVVVFGKPTVLWGLIPLALIALTLDVLRVKSAALNQFLDAFFGWMMRPTERPAYGDPVAFNGATWVVTSMALLTVLFPVPVAVSAFLVFMLGDAAAALVGRKLGRHPWSTATESRTVEGTIAFFVVGGATAVLLATTGLVALPLWALGVMTLTAGLLEAAPLPLNDNLAAPLGAAIVLHLIL